jgi:hypothetical protein
MGQLEQPAYHNYLMLDQGDYYLLRYQPRNMRPFGKDTGFTLQVQITEKENGETEIIAQEAYSLMFRSIVGAFAVIGLFGAFANARYDWLVLTLIIVVGTWLLNRSYTSSMFGTFDELMAAIQSDA